MDNIKKRPSWDEYFMNIAHVTSSRSNCKRRHVGAVIVKNNRIVSTGYNGTPRGITNCFEGGCPRCNSNAATGERLDECYCCHAEENAIVQAAYHGVSVRDSTMYTTSSPCLLCTKMIINAGIKEVVYHKTYKFEETVKKLFAQTGIIIRELA